MLERMSESMSRRIGVGSQDASRRHFTAPSRELENRSEREKRELYCAIRGKEERKKCQQFLPEPRVC